MNKIAVLISATLLSITTVAQNTANDYEDVSLVNNATIISTTEKSYSTKEYRTTTDIKKSNLVFTNVINNLNTETLDWIKTFSQKKNYVNGIYIQGKTYFPKVNKIFAKKGIPTELNVILAIESYFNKNCVSKTGAVGYWQFMDATAVEYGLNISDSLKDDRRDLDKSTKAAAQYLKNHYAIFKDWYLTVASYNCGGGNVKKAMAKSGKANPTFFDIKKHLPAETQNYVMKYIALNILFKNYNKYINQSIEWGETNEEDSYTSK